MGRSASCAGSEDGRRRAQHPTPGGQRCGPPRGARAELTAVEGRKLTFRVEAFDDAGKIGEGEHQRFIIEVERFMQRAAARK